MRYSAVALLFALVPLSAADDKKPDEPVKAGDVLRVGPGGVPFPTQGVPLAASSKDAEEVLRLFKDKKKEGVFEKYLEMCESGNLPYLRSTARVKATGPVDPAGNIPVEVVAGSNKGKTGWVPAVLTGAKILPPKNPVKVTEEVKKKVFETYFALLTESFQEARKDAKPKATLWEIERSAAIKLGQKLDKASKGLGIELKDWLDIVQQGFADGMTAAWREK